jgi:hypothetical protein
MLVRYICTLVLEGKCFEPCYHTRPHRPTFGCDYTTCLDEPRKCIPFVGRWNFCEMTSGEDEPAPDAPSPA